MSVNDSAVSTGDQPVGTDAPNATAGAAMDTTAPEGAIESAEDGSQYSPGEADSDSNDGDGSEYVPEDKATGAKDGTEGEAKEAAGVGDVPASPDGYVFQEPEGFAANNDRMGEFRNILYGSGVSNEKAQELFDLYVNDRKAMTGEVMDTFMKELDARKAARDTEQAKRCMEDPDFGGQNLKKSGTYIAKAVRTFLPNEADRKEFDTFFREAGLRNEYSVWKLLAAAGRIVSEGHTASSSPGSGRQEKTVAENLYPGFESIVSGR